MAKNKEAAPKMQRGQSRSHAKPIVKLPKAMKILLGGISDKETRAGVRSALLDAIYAAEVYVKTSGKKKDTEVTA